nr:hypothetical protein [Tanacetum cinerariifolium]
MFMVQRELGLPNVYTKVGMLIGLMMLMLMASLFLKYQVCYVNKYKLMEVFIEHPIDNYVMDTVDLEQEDASAGLGDENVGNVANDLGDENVENVSNDLRDENVKEFDPLFSYPHMQTDNNEGKRG